MGRRSKSADYWSKFEKARMICVTVCRVLCLVFPAQLERGLNRDFNVADKTEKNLF